MIPKEKGSRGKIGSPYLEINGLQETFLSNFLAIFELCVLLQMIL